MKRILSLWAILFAPFLLSGCLFDLSPDGSQIVISSMVYESEKERDARPTLAIIDGKSSEFRAIPDSEGGGFPVWSPDGKFIAFRKENSDKGDENNKELWVFDFQDNATRFIEAGEENVVQWVWRDDSTLLLGLSWPEQNQELLWIDPETQTVTRRLDLKRPLAMNFDVLPQFLPDSDEAIFLRGTERGFDLCLTNQNGFKTITTTGGVAAFGISKEAKRLLWIRQPKRNSSANLALFSCDFNGQNVRRLPFLPQISKSDAERGWHSEARFIFSPDAKHLAVVDSFLATPDPKTRKLRQIVVCHLIEVQTSKARVIYRKNNPIESEKGGRNNTFIDPKWSRDGKRLALLGVDIGKSAELSVFDGNGQNPRRVPLPAQKPTQSAKRQ